jgi:U5 small nuclear ribonucleoprotein component
VRGPNILLNDTLPDEVDQPSLLAAKQAIVQGFQWAVREGPLTEAPIRAVKFRLVDALLAAEPIHRTAGQLIPTARRLCYSAILTATPRLMEPLATTEIVCPKDVTDVVYQLLARRRGHVLTETPKAGTPLVVLRALLPLLDSCGFETDLRTNTLGSALPQSIPAHWQVVPGDPLDTSLRLVPLEPAPAPHLARDLFLKTRRRKGLPAEISPARFFDDSMLDELAREQAISGIGSLSL